MHINFYIEQMPINFDIEQMYIYFNLNKCPLIFKEWHVENTFSSEINLVDRKIF